MRLRAVLLGAACAFVLIAAGIGGWLLSLPPSVKAQSVAIPAAETQAMVEALRPQKRARPVVAVIGINDGTETTDYLLPAGVLRRADVADVHLIATSEGPVTLFPALQVEPDMTIAGFDAAYPDGADYVIVPAMMRDDDPVALAWIEAQASKGSLIIGICAGAKIVAAAGLLDERQGTTHWFSRNDLTRLAPTITQVADRRFVVDGPVATTTGITASMPLALTLVEAIAGPERAAQTAAGIGIEHWDAGHDSQAFGLSREFVTTVMANAIAFWQYETVSIRVGPDFDAISLALVADSWSRTYRSHAISVATEPGVVRDATGIGILPDVIEARDEASGIIIDGAQLRPAAALDHALAAIEGRYGGETASVVAVQLEYPGAL